MRGKYPFFFPKRVASSNPKQASQGTELLLNTGSHLRPCHSASPQDHFSRSVELSWAEIFVSINEYCGVARSLAQIPWSLLPSFFNDQTCGIHFWYSSKAGIMQETGLEDWSRPSFSYFSRVISQHAISQWLCHTYFLSYSRKSFVFQPFYSKPWIVIILIRINTQVGTPSCSLLQLHR